jgi:DNA topoisomerase VI subunit B
VPATLEPMPKTRPKQPKPAPRATAETMALKQRDISVSEFFAKNRHLLGFDNPRKALLTTVKEAVDNSLDACEEAGILPDLTVVIEDLQPDRPSTAKSSRYRVTVVDNGPGIVRKQVEHIFGRLLYGSKFHRLKMSRGQQGIGISAAGMYGLLTTGKPTVIHTKPKHRAPAHHIELAMNTKTNRAEVTVDTETADFPPARLRTLTPGTREAGILRDDDYATGTSVSIELDGRYQRGRGSVDEFLELTAIANPHARITFVPPSKESGAEEDDLALLAGPGNKAPPEPSANGQAAVPPVAPAITTEIRGVVIHPRGVHELPPETQEIQPHPKGIELGILLQMFKDHPEGTLYNFLQERFSRVSSATAGQLCQKIGVHTRTKVVDIDHELAEKLYREFQDARLPPPPTDCLAPIGVRQLLAGMLKGVRAEFYAASTREPAVYRGRPFQIEAAIAFGGELPTEDSARVIRFANRVPLLFQQSACSSFKAVTDTNWRNYDLQQPRNSGPIGALVIMIHMASVWVPFTSESKEAIADYDEIRKEMKLALMECGRKLGTYLRKRLKMRRESERRDVFERYIGEIAKAVNAINGADAKKLYDALLEQARKRTAIADVQLDEEGRKIKRPKPEEQEEGVIIVESARPELKGKPPSDVTSDEPPITMSRAEAAALKVAALAKSDDEPKLIDTEPVGRTARKSKRHQPRPPAPASSRGRPTPAPSRTGRRDSDRAADVAPVSRPPSPETSKTPTPPKPKMRLVNGKLVPSDDSQQLFT